MAIPIQDLIQKEDLGDPYDSMIDFLELGDIIKLEAEFGGLYINFKKSLVEDEQYVNLQCLLGKDKALKVMKRFSGSKIYFPAFRKACTDKIKKMIVDEFNGYNYAKLAKRFGYCERHVRRIVAGSKKKKSTGDENQIRLW